MKKLFVSVPMRGRTEENIKSTINKLHTIAEAIVGEELELIDSYFDDFPNGAEVKHPKIYYLGKSIQKLAEADYFISTDLKYEFKGTQHEYSIACDYGITILPDMPCHVVAPDAVDSVRTCIPVSCNTVNDRW